jgi:phosphatidylglycerophosphate synthase
MIALAAAGLLISAAGGLALAGGDTAGMVASGALFFLCAAVAVKALGQGYPHEHLGACNAVTLLRAVMTGVLAAPLAAPGLLAADPGVAWAVFAVAAVALALDGVDGWLARRSGLASAYGARFDMEVDSLLALVLACLALANGKAGLWILALGGMRYAFVVAGWALPWLNGTLPEQRRRKTVCVVQIAVLVALVSPVLVAPAATMLALAATALLGWSFTVDILWLARRR